MTTTKDTKLLGVFGKPLAHTLSPKIHSYFSEKMGLDRAYLAFELESAEDLQPIVKAATKMDARGFNITAPYKIDIMKCVDFIDPEAEIMEAVNTIVNRGGKWYGYNTDGDAFVKSLEDLVGNLAGKKVLMLGAGGAARGVAYKLAKKEIASITFSAKTRKRAETIGEIVTKYTDCAVFYELNEKEKYDIIINTTPLGMHPYESENPFAEHMDMIDKDTVCCDLIYNPKKTVFLDEAQKKGAKILNGLGMFVLQAVYAYELFCDVKLDDEIIKGAMELLSEYSV